MRTSLARYGVTAITLVFLAGCTSSGGKWWTPSWSLSSLNPWSSPSDDLSIAPHVATPASLASPATTIPSAAGYAAATSDTGIPSGAYPTATASYDASTGGYPQTASAAAADNPYTTPQSGLYGSAQGYGSTYGASPSSYGASPASAANSSPYDSSASMGYRTATRDPAATGAGSAYQSGSSPYSGYSSGSSTSSSPYGADGSSSYSYPDNRYGSGTSATSPYASDSSTSPYGSDNYGSGSGQSTTPYANSSNSAYGAGSGYGTASGTPAANSYQPNYYNDRNTSGSRYGSDSVYSNGSSGNSVGSGAIDPYQPAMSGTTGAKADSDASAYNSNTAPSPYGSGSTDYLPYYSPSSPSGTSSPYQYQPPAGSYTPPGATTPTNSPYLPGSTKLYTPPKTILSDASRTPSNVDSTTDSDVKPASYTLPAFDRG